MDSHYIIERLKSTPYKYPTVALLKTRISNLEEEVQHEILSSLKMQLHKERNLDIQLSLEELVYRCAAAS